jgi:hypothetical protein
MTAHSAMTHARGLTTDTGSSFGTKGGSCAAISSCLLMLLPSVDARNESARVENPLRVDVAATPTIEMLFMMPFILPTRLTRARIGDLPFSVSLGGSRCQHKLPPRCIIHSTAQKNIISALYAMFVSKRSVESIGLCAPTMRSVRKWLWEAHGRGSQLHRQRESMSNYEMSGISWDVLTPRAPVFPLLQLTGKEV